MGKETDQKDGQHEDPVSAQGSRGGSGSAPTRVVTPLGAGLAIGIVVVVLYVGVYANPLATEFALSADLPAARPKRFATAPSALFALGTFHLLTAVKDAVSI